MEESVKPREQKYPVIFSGETGEWFRIWIVNMALTIVTLGIYSAWAKVRKERYFYSHTSVADGTFDFHASPKAILFGRLIAVTMVLLYFGSSYIHPFAPLAIIMLIFLLVPWLVVRSRIFRMRNSSYRGIRFNFNPDYKGAFAAYYGGAIVTVVSLSFATPTAIFWKNRFAVRNSGFGRTRFSFGGRSEDFYAIYYKMLGLGILGFIIFGFFSAMFSEYAPNPANMSQEEYGRALIIFTYATTLPIFLFYMALGVYMQVRIRNHIWNTASLGRNYFQSTLSVASILFIYLTNMLAIVFSIGLLVPWAQIRLAKYRADQTKVILADSWEDYIAAEEKAGSALGDEIGEAFDVDIDIGI
jgi:uncharacterized membrane protein YjgN (DUF898 family)